MRSPLSLTSAWRASLLLLLLLPGVCEGAAPPSSPAANVLMGSSAAAPPTSPATPASQDGWTTATATFFDAPDAFKKLEPHDFGTVWSGACQFVNYPRDTPRSDADVVFPLSESIAIGSSNPDFKQGMCGRCYELRCRTGYPRNDYNSPASSLIPVDTNFSLYKYAPDWKDSYGRPFPDPQLEGKLPYVWTQCWDESKVTFGRVVDLCQCNNPWGRNPPCCTPAPHLDLSYWAFEQLAHPLFGNAIVQYRPVDCGTRQPLTVATHGVPGGATGNVYDRSIVAGWGVNLFKPINAVWQQPAYSSACATLSPSPAAMAFDCLRCSNVFTSGAVKLALRTAQPGSFAPVASDCPPPQLQLLVSYKPFDGDGGGEQFCNNKPDVSKYKTGCDGGMGQYSVPFADLGCAFGMAKANRVALVSTSGEVSSFCLQSLRV